MKLEIAVRTPESFASSNRAKVERLIVRQGETVKAGGHIALVRVG